MQILIVGAGAIGSYFAAKLSQNEVTLFDIDQQKVDIINEKGLILREIDGSEQAFKLKAVANIEDAPQPDLILVMVKTYDTARVAREIAQINDGKFNVLSLQNGLGSIGILEKSIDPKQLYSGVTYHGAYQIEPGHICHAGSGLTILGANIKRKGGTVVPISSLNVAMELARLLNNCQIPAGTTTDIDPIRWKKLIINSAINPISAISGKKNGQLPKDADCAHDMMELVLEGVAVAQKMGIPMDSGEMWASVLDTCRATAENRSSMLADVEAGRMTEIEFINGSIVRLGEQNGLDTPINSKMVRSVVAIHGKNDIMRVE